ncbi:MULTISPECIES: peptidoglycan editing factor PgeF [unclassified Corynebacterium]|uniref:peptidoglycan editing factor PgeF n=1 Tax=unclassified Corynebacterium TaxID=2624378 RepID=UPI0029CA0C85|nr:MULTISPECIES: peptidoglycan editing factor PgeF [unclassified Corynebacterium]WPF65437.1 peptidoglycan editing factor PgeF [Corynebacterium sp. 22KM0430]WPF67933.1 peptidoglycan editing factor PgeF [Corynebacterium sp. 21KM1197]
MPLTDSPRPVRKVFTSRAGGVSAAPYSSFNLALHVDDDPQDVLANRRRLAQVVGVPAERFVWMEQLHTNTVTVVTQPESEPVAATDALVTTTPNLVLAVLVADCVPVLLSDTEAGVVAAVHAGRLGARNGILPRTIEAMARCGARPENVHALLGPAAAGESYEVPEAMARDVEVRLPGSYTRTQAGTPGLDLRAGLVRQLRGLGVRAVDVDPRDTIADEQFFSHRREGRTGRQVGLVWLEGSEA